MRPLPKHLVRWPVKVFAPLLDRLTIGHRER